MTAFAQADNRAVTEGWAQPDRLSRAAELASYAGAVSAVAFAIVTVRSSITEDGHAFRHAADYWYTGIGMIPAMLAPLVLVQALHRLQAPRDGRRGRTGATLLSLALGTYVVMGVAGLATGRASSFGPTYLLAALGSIIGLVTFVAGSWRLDLLPRRLLAAWIVGWLVGGPLAQSALPVVLAAVYVAIGITVRRRSSGQPARDLIESRRGDLGT